MGNERTNLAIKISNPAVIFSPRSAGGRSGWSGGGSRHPRGGANGCCASCAYWHLVETWGDSRAPHDYMTRSGSFQFDQIIHALAGMPTGGTLFCGLS
eukprot:1134494-Pelagomonas_calceolata.AAC.12